jgi:hypothetical protein
MDEPKKTNTKYITRLSGEPNNKLHGLSIFQGLEENLLIWC